MENNLFKKICLQIKEKHTDIKYFIPNFDQQTYLLNSNAFPCPRIVPEVVSPDTGAPLSPPVIISPIQHTSAPEGGSARLQCRVSGEGKHDCTDCPTRWTSAHVPCAHKRCHKASAVFFLFADVLFLDMMITWFCKDKEIKQSNFFRISQFDDSCQLEIARVYPEDEGEYTCVARNSAGMVSCSAVLKLEGEFNILFNSMHICDHAPATEYDGNFNNFLHLQILLVL